MGSLNPVKQLCFLTIVKVRGLKSMCQQDWSLLRTLKENLFYDSVLACGGLPAISGISWLVEPSSQSPPLCSHGILSVCMAVSKLSHCIRTPVLLHESPLLRLYFNLIPSIKTQGYILRYWGLEIEHIFGGKGGHNSVCNTYLPHRVCR